MKARDQRSFENENAQDETNQRDRAAGCDGQTDVARAEHRPQENRDDDRWQRNEDRHRPCRDAFLWIRAHQQAEERAAEHAHDQLSKDGRADAKLLEMIVTADATHQREKRSRLYENRKAIADNCERRRDAEHCEDQHHNCHRDSGDQACQ